MGLCFQKDMYLASAQIYPSLDNGETFKLSKIQVTIYSRKLIFFKFKIRVFEMF